MPRTESPWLIVKLVAQGDEDGPVFCAAWPIRNDHAASAMNKHDEASPIDIALGAVHACKISFAAQTRPHLGARLEADSPPHGFDYRGNPCLGIHLSGELGLMPFEDMAGQVDAALRLFCGATLPMTRPGDPATIANPIFFDNASSRDAGHAWVIESAQAQAEALALASSIPTDSRRAPAPRV